MGCKVLRDLAIAQELRLASTSRMCCARDGVSGASKLHAQRVMIRDQTRGKHVLTISDIRSQRELARSLHRSKSKSKEKSHVEKHHFARWLLRRISLCERSGSANST
jgi:hypothetical protein